MRTRLGRAETEVYFRIVHVAQEAHSGDPVASYREQTVEIALGLIVQSPLVAPSVSFPDLIRLH